MIELTVPEVRVLASLVEKEITTPDYYPMTLNSLVAACNQKSNRDPVVTFDEKTVVRALDGLREKKLAWMVHAAGSRVPKYEHRMTEQLPLDKADTAVLCLLMLRGPQTTGELKGRSGRLYPFVTIAEVEQALHRLASREEGALVLQLPRQTGHKECRWAHLLAGTPEIDETECEPPHEAARLQVESERQLYEHMEAEIQELREQLQALSDEFARFRRQFE